MTLQCTPFYRDVCEQACRRQRERERRGGRWSTLSGREISLAILSTPLCDCDSRQKPRPKPMTDDAWKSNFGKCVYDFRSSLPFQIPARGSQFSALSPVSCSNRHTRFTCSLHRHTTLRHRCSTASTIIAIATSLGLAFGFATLCILISHFNPIPQTRKLYIMSKQVDANELKNHKSGEFLQYCRC